MRPLVFEKLFSLPLMALVSSCIACEVTDGSMPGSADFPLVAESINYDGDGDGLGGMYDCDDDDESLPDACPMAEPDPGRPVWCDDGLAVPESRSLMNWVNQLQFVDGVAKGLREYLYDHEGDDRVPEECNVALLATRGGPQDANTEQLTRYVMEGLGPAGVGYVLGGRSFWPNNSEDWDYPNHAIDLSCPSADGRTRLKDVMKGCTVAVTLRRISPWDSCGGPSDGNAILIGGGQADNEYPKANLIRALKEAIDAGELGTVNEVVDIDTLHWSNACRAGLGARGCCHLANATRLHSGHPGVQLIVPTTLLTYGPICKNPDDPLHKFECSDLSAHPPLQALGDVLRDVLAQAAGVRRQIESGSSPEDLISASPLSDEALIAVLRSDWKDKDKILVLEANQPLSDRVLLVAAEVLEQDNRMAALFGHSSPLSVRVMLALVNGMDNDEFLERVLLANSPGLPEAITLALMETVQQKNLVSDVLLANSPDLSDAELWAAIEALGKSPQLTEVLLSNCPLSAPVLEAAKAELSSRDFSKVEQCQSS